LPRVSVIGPSKITPLIWSWLTFMTGRLPKPLCRPVEGKASGELPEGASRRCAKLIELPYSVRVNGVNEPRQATVEIIVIQDAEGRPLKRSFGAWMMPVFRTLACRAVARSTLQMI